MKKSHHHDHQWPYIAIVGVVAIVAIALMMQGGPSWGTSEDTNTAGHAAKILTKGVLHEEGKKGVNTEQTCEDSDPSQHVRTVGSIIQQDARGVSRETHVDRCLSSTRLEQASCVPDEKSKTKQYLVQRQETTCAGGCSAGACLPVSYEIEFEMPLGITPNNYQDFSTAYIKLNGERNDADWYTSNFGNLPDRFRYIYAERIRSRYPTSYPPGRYSNGEIIRLNHATMNTRIAPTGTLTSTSSIELQDLDCGAYDFEAEYSYTPGVGENMRLIPRKKINAGNFQPLGTHTYSASSGTVTLQDGSKLRIDAPRRTVIHPSILNQTFAYSFAFTCP